GYIQGESVLVVRGIGLFLFGLVVISTVDNVLKPFIIAGRTRVHPLLVLIGVFGGLYFFGFIGLIIGPFVLSLFQTLFEIYEREHAHTLYHKT
ncbi:MAG TPA: AI-2E family transporter, partial [Candidatus Nanoarchaeia archaeon]|nr:AI-2E family transporter [Candidatus Nanoarchaeia archaeon]